ncbi:mlr4403 [Mesorhizobium japonicum MAFF 303099]|uniref:Mlr4403 protein n=3 Tax=Mesorhizobium TaxID=68287 RepID=Q98E54_RHILO|nr:mlr4403 [Mesorhizobium japonicum MAFF 303099]
MPGKIGCCPAGKETYRIILFVVVSQLTCIQNELKSGKDYRLSAVNPLRVVSFLLSQYLEAAMITHVIGIPDKNGIIRVSCGSDIIEIQVVPPAGGSAGEPAGGEVDPPPGPVGINPGDIPVIYLTVPKKAGGELDLEQLLKDYEGRISDPDKPNPSMILFQAQHADLHEVSRLKQQIAKEMRDLPLAIDFGDLGYLEK